MNKAYVLFCELGIPESGSSGKNGRSLATNDLKNAIILYINENDSIKIRLLLKNEDLLILFYYNSINKST